MGLSIVGLMFSETEGSSAQESRNLICLHFRCVLALIMVPLNTCLMLHNCI